MSFRIVRGIAIVLPIVAILLGIVAVSTHTFAAHADGQGGAQLRVRCHASDNQFDSNNIASIKIIGDNQYGVQITWESATSYLPCHPSRR